MPFHFFTLIFQYLFIYLFIVEDLKIDSVYDATFFIVVNMSSIIYFMFLKYFPIFVFLETGLYKSQQVKCAKFYGDFSS